MNTDGGPGMPEKIADLEIGLILKLFDKTINEHAAAALRSLFLLHPIPLEVARERQQDLKILLSKSEELKKYRYAPIDFREVHYYLNSNIEKQTRRIGILLRLNKDLPRLRGKITQAVMFLNRVRVLVQALENEKFSVFFQNRINNLKAYLRILATGELVAGALENRILPPEVVHLNNWFFEKAQSKETACFYEDLAILEAYISIALSIGESGFVFPGLSENELLLKQCYHPLLESPVKNDFVKKNNVVVLTGANMSGKSTFLKTVSLCVYLGNIGLPVPAEAAVIPLFDEMLISIHRRDNIRKGYSHFLNELMNLKTVLESIRAGKSYFAVFDEIFSGTASADAAEILATTLKGLTGRKSSFFLISTHLSGENLEAEKGDTDHYHLECLLVEGHPSYNYQLKPGWSGMRVGAILYETMGLRRLLE